MAPPSVSVVQSSSPEEQVDLEKEQEEEEGIVHNSGASPKSQRRARSRSRARARRRSLSQLPSDGSRAPSSDEEEVAKIEASGGMVKNTSSEVAVIESKDMSEKNSSSDGEVGKGASSGYPDDEHIWLIPKATRRAQKQRNKMAAWNASGHQLLKSNNSSFLNRGDTSGRKQNL